MLIDKNEMCFELIEKINEDVSDNNPLKSVIAYIVQKFSSLTGIQSTSEGPSPAKARSSPSSKKYRSESDEFNPDGYHLFDRIHKLEHELICRIRSLRLQGPCHDSKAAAR